MTKTMPNNELRELRRIAGLTQAKLGNLLNKRNKKEGEVKAFLKSLAPEQKNFLASLSPRECCALLDYLNKKGTNNDEDNQD